MKLYKVTGPAGESFHGGSFQWDLPKDGQPGAWTPEAIPSLCNSGYHLTANIPDWWKLGCRIWEAEGRGASNGDEIKSAHASARLVREITDATELASLGVFASGAHEIKQGKAIASGSASVRASGSASVEACDSASVEAFDSASVRASGSASVEAYDSASVRAYGSASVWASGSASVWAFNSVSVWAYGSVSVRACDSASVWAFNSATVNSWQLKPNVQVSDKAVHIARGDGTKAPKIHVTKKGKSK